MSSIMVQSWFDLPVVEPVDPRLILQSIALQDQAGTVQNATFSRSSTWLKNTTWANPPMATSVRSSTIISNVAALNTYDFPSVEAAATWNNSHAMTLTSSGFPIALQKVMFLKAGSQFVNTIYLDWSAGVTSTDVQFSFRDNSLTSGDFTNAAIATIPVFAFPTTATFGGTGRTLAVTVLTPGRFQVALRIFDSAGNWSLFEMEWYVIA